MLVSLTGDAPSLRAAEAAAGRAAAALPAGRGAPAWAAARPVAARPPPGWHWPGQTDARAAAPQCVHAGALPHWPFAPTAQDALVPQYIGVVVPTQVNYVAKAALVVHPPLGASVSGGAEVATSLLRTG